MLPIPKSKSNQIESKLKRTLDLFQLNLAPGHSIDQRNPGLSSWRWEAEEKKAPTPPQQISHHHLLSAFLLCNVR